MRRERYPGVKFMKRPLMVEIGARIRRYRLEAGLSVQALARLTHLAPRRIARIEAGLDINGLDPYYQLADALGIPRDELFDEDDRLN